MNNASHTTAHLDPDRLSNSNWKDANLPTLRSPEAFNKRVRFILERLNLDTWLPSSLRFKIATHCERILADTESTDISPDYAKTAIEELASEVYPYDDYTLESSTLCQIRTLDLELNDIRTPAEPTARPLLAFDTTKAGLNTKASA